MVGPTSSTRSLSEAEDAWRMKVEGGRARRVGIAGEGYDVERHGETVQSTAYVWMHDGTTNIWSKISQDGEYHVHDDHLKDHHLPKTLPYGLPFALSQQEQQYSTASAQRRRKVARFSPNRIGMKAGPWSPFVQLHGDDRLSDHRVNCSKGPCGGQDQDCPCCICCCC